MFVPILGTLNTIPCPQFGDKRSTLDNALMIKHINHPKYERLIAWLKRTREERGLTVREFGEMLGESHQFVNKVETMQRRLNVFEFVQYCEVLGVEPNDGLALLRQTSKGEV